MKVKLFIIILIFMVHLNLLNRGINGENVWGDLIKIKLSHKFHSISLCNFSLLTVFRFVPNLFSKIQFPFNFWGIQIPAMKWKIVLG